MGVLIAQATLTRLAVRCTCSARLSNSKLESFIVLMDLIERPGAGYSRPEGSGAQAHIHTATQSNSSHVVVYSRVLLVLHAKACTTPCTCAPYNEHAHNRAIVSAVRAC